MLELAPLLLPFPGDPPFSATWAVGFGIGPSDFTGEDGGGLVGALAPPTGPLTLPLALVLP